MVAYGEDALALAGHKALDQGPIRALPAYLHRCGELRGVAGIRDAPVGKEAGAVPGNAETGLYDTGIPDGLRGLPTFVERGRVAGGRDFDSARFRPMERLGLVEGSGRYDVRRAADDHPPSFPLLPLIVTQLARQLRERQDDAHAAHLRPGTQRREHFVGRFPVAEAPATVPGPPGQGPSPLAGDEDRVARPAQRPHAGQRRVRGAVQHQDAIRHQPPRATVTTRPRGEPGGRHSVERWFASNHAWNMSTHQRS